MQIDFFVLVGTMSYEKGFFAFFDGSHSDYKRVLKREETIAGFKVAAIGPHWHCRLGACVSAVRRVNLARSSSQRGCCKIHGRTKCDELVKIP